MEDMERQMQRLTEMFAPEELHPDLVHHLLDSGALGMMIHHPLVIEVIYRPEMNKMINARYAHKIKAREEARIKADWRSYVFIHERPYRFEALQKAMSLDEVLGEKMAKVIGSIWTDSENIYEFMDEWVEVWDGLKNADLLHYTMTEEEKEALDAMPDMITVYRGTNEDYATSYGMSWTTSQEKAGWFAKRFSGRGKPGPVVLTGTIRKSDVYCYLMARNEDEIVLDPFQVTVEE